MNGADDPSIVSVDFSISAQMLSVVSVRTATLSTTSGVLDARGGQFLLHVLITVITAAVRIITSTNCNVYSL